MSESNGGSSPLSTIVQGSSILFIGLVLELGFSFFGKLVLARFLGPIDFGSVALGLTTMTLLGAIFSLNLNTGVGRYLPRYDDVAERRGVLVSAFTISLISTGVGTVLLLLAAPWVARTVFGDPTMTPILRVFALVLPLAAFVELSTGTVQGLQHSFPRVYIENITLPFVRLFGFAVVVLFGLGAFGASLAYLAAYLCSSILGLFYLIRHTSLFSFRTDFTPHYKELLVFSLPLALSSTMAFVFNDVDTILIGYFFTAKEVGVYNVVYALANLLSMSLYAVGFIFMPVMSELHSNGAKRDMRVLYQVVTKWIFVATLPLFLIVALFPVMTITITFGGEYASGASSLSVLAFAFFSHAVAGPNSKALTSIGQTRTIMAITGIAAVLNIALNLVLIPVYSVYGAAVATAISYVMMNLLYSYRLYRATGVHPVTRSLVLPGAIGITLVVVVYSIATTMVRITIPSLISLFVVFLLLYGSVVLRFGIEDHEVEIVMGFEEKYGLDLGPLKTVAKIVME